MAKMVTICPASVVDFFDDKKADLHHHIGSVIAVLGEDLAAGLLKHYFENSVGVEVRVYDGAQPNTGKKKGRRLDRWIRIQRRTGESNLFQTEIKSWSAYAIGGTHLPLNAPEDTMKTVTKKYWDDQWKGIDQDTERGSNGVSKVLIPMKNIPEGAKHLRLEPLLIYWLPLAPDGKYGDGPLFKITLKNNRTFSHVWIFSMSLYLRQLVDRGIDKIEVEMENAAFRMERLRELMSLV